MQRFMEQPQWQHGYIYLLGGNDMSFNFFNYGTTYQGFADGYVEHENKYGADECFPGFLYYKSERHYPKVKICNDVKPQQVVIFNYIMGNKDVTELQQLKTNCGNTWCCNRHHIERA